MILNPEILYHSKIIYSMKEQFILGPLQETWLQSLEQHPERQMKAQLAKRDPDGTYQACCLGEACIILTNAGVITSTWENDALKDDYSKEVFVHYDAMGLNNSVGQLKVGFDTESHHVRSLATMNDEAGYTWPQIAAYIRANPENVFTRSV